MSVVNWTATANATVFLGILRINTRQFYQTITEVLWVGIKHRWLKPKYLHTRNWPCLQEIWHQQFNIIAIKLRNKPMCETHLKPSISSQKYYSPLLSGWNSSLSAHPYPKHFVCKVERERLCKVGALFKGRILRQRHKFYQLSLGWNIILTHQLCDCNLQWNLY